MKDKLWKILFLLMNFQLRPGVRYWKQLVDKSKPSPINIKSPVISIICSGCILETGKCWQAHCSPIGWYFVSTNYQPIGEYMRVGLVWPCTRNYTIDRPLSENCSLKIWDLKIKLRDYWDFITQIFLLINWYYYWFFHLLASLLFMCK